MAPLARHLTLINEYKSEGNANPPSRTLENGSITGTFPCSLMYWRQGNLPSTSRHWRKVRKREPIGIGKRPSLALAESYVA